MPSPCPRCGAQLDREAAEGLCPKCLLTAFLAVEPPPARPGMRIGEHELLAELGAGGMGVVFRARDPRLKREVALKMVKGGAFASEADQQKFRDEATTGALLEHPNIVRVLHVGEGEDDAGPFFTMELMKGGSLAEHLSSFRADRRQACELVAAIAHAVHHAHDRGYLHRDLKPANVLLDSNGKPHIADFGAAKSLEDSRGLTRTGAVIGTAGYMAPEQARGEKGTTRAVDTWGLGAILYELLTGRPPFEAPTYEGTLQLVREAEPPAPRTLDPSIERDLETVCLKCLEKNPARRYGSAEALAEELERYLRGDNIEARPIGRLLRSWRWILRHPVIAAVGASLLIIAVTALSASLQQEAVGRRESLAANSYAARMAAGTVLFQLRQNAEAFQFRQYADQVQRPAQDSRLLRLLEMRDYQGLFESPLPVGVAMPRGLTSFDSWLVLDENGEARARWPAPPEGYFPRHFARRDFFLGALQIAQAGKRLVHVSQVFEDEADGRARFAFSTPMFGSDGAMVGVVVALVATDSALGSIALSAGGDSSRTTALVGPRDLSQHHDGPLQREYVFLFHEGLERGRLIAFDQNQLTVPERLSGEGARPTGEQLGHPDPARVASVDPYLDPVSGYEGRWLAGIAPVGDTGFMVVVQTRYEVVLQPILRALQYVALPLAAGLLVGLAALRVRRLRKVRRVL